MEQDYTTTPIKRYKKVLGSKVERIRQVRQRRAPLRAQVEVVTLEDCELPPVQLPSSHHASRSKPRRRDAELLRPVKHQEIKVTLPPMRLTIARRVLSKSTGIQVTYFSEHIEITLPEIESVEHCDRIIATLLNIHIAKPHYSKWTIDFRALSQLPLTLINTVSELHQSLIKQKCELLLVVNEDRHIKTPPAQPIDSGTTLYFETVDERDSYNIRRALQ